MQHSGAGWEKVYQSKSRTGLDRIWKAGREGGQNRIGQDRESSLAAPLDGRDGHEHGGVCGSSKLSTAAMCGSQCSLPP